jgi:hypothetical protein
MWQDQAKIQGMALRQFMHRGKGEGNRCGNRHIQPDQSLRAFGPPAVGGGGHWGCIVNQYNRSKYLIVLHCGILMFCCSIGP